jgi:hypothetical protein
VTDDLLKAATRALREDAADDGGDGRFTRARVMASLHQGKVKRRTRLAFILPIAACLAAGTAWGAATGRLPAVFQAVGQLVGYSSQPSAPKADERGASTSPKVAAAPDAQVPPPAVDVPAEPGPAVEAAPVVEAKPEPSKIEAAPSAKSSAAPRSSAAFQDADGDLYRLAHEAHFASHDYTRALAGWNAYLQAAPGGRLATEARYNRAICLLRLGRDAEARQALEPFASGQQGYRQNEARELLEELSR